MKQPSCSLLSSLEEFSQPSFLAQEGSDFDVVTYAIVSVTETEQLTGPCYLALSLRSSILSCTQCPFIERTWDYQRQYDTCNAHWDDCRCVLVRGRINYCNQLQDGESKPCADISATQSQDDQRKMCVSNDKCMFRVKWKGNDCIKKSTPCADRITKSMSKDEQEKVCQSNGRCLFDPGFLNNECRDK